MQSRSLVKLVAIATVPAFRKVSSEMTRAPSVPPKLKLLVIVSDLVAAHLSVTVYGTMATWSWRNVHPAGLINFCAAGFKCTTLKHNMAQELRRIQSGGDTRVLSSTRSGKAAVIDIVLPSVVLATPRMTSFNSGA